MANWAGGVISHFPQASLRSANASGQTHALIWSDWTYVGAAGYGYDMKGIQDARL